MGMKSLFLSVLSGLLLTLGFPKPEIFYLSWIALVPLLLALKGKSGKEAFLLGYVCGMAHYVTTLYWIQYVVQHFGGIPLPVAVLLVALLSGYLALYPACFAAVAHRWQGHPLLEIFGLPGVWVALEWVRGAVLTGFPWANLGYTQTPWSLLIQMADVTGVFGLSWLVVLGNTTLLSCLKGRCVRWSLPVFVLCLSGTLVYGSWRMDNVRALEKTADSWTVAVIQGNIDQARKWDPAFQQETLRRYRELSMAAAAGSPRPDLIVWPETAAPFFYGVEEGLTEQLNGMVRDLGVPLLFGSPAITILDGEPRFQNRAYLLDARANILGWYAKQHLVPFGEYVPLQELLFFVHRLVQAAGDFVPGHDPQPLRWEDRGLGVLICYEGIFPALARRTVLAGASCLVNITNDAWYGRTSAPYQHLEIERWRAIELRVPMIRAANTGISTVIDAAGESCGRIELDLQGEMVCNVRSPGLLTIYARWGDIFVWFCMAASMGCMVYSTLKRRSAKSI